MRAPYNPFFRKLARPALMLLPLLVLVACGSNVQPTLHPPTPELPTPTVALEAAPVTTAENTAVVTTPSPVPTIEPLAPTISPANAGSLTKLSQLGMGEVADLEYSPDGSRLAVATRAGLYLYHADSLNEVAFLPESGGTGFMAFSPDGSLLLTSAGKEIKIWNSADGSPAGSLEINREAYTWEVGFSPDGQYIYAVLSDNTVSIWSSTSREHLHTFEGNQLAISPAGDTALVYAYEGSWIYLYDLPGGGLVNKWNGRGAGYLPTGQAWVADEGSIRIMDLMADTVTAPFQGNQAAFSEDGQFLSLFWGSRIIIYEVERGRVLQTLEGAYESVVELRFSPGGQYLAGRTSRLKCADCSPTDGMIDELIVWDNQSGEIVSTLGARYLWFDFSTAGEQLAAAGLEVVTLFDTSNGEEVYAMRDFTASIAGIDISRDGKTLAAASDAFPYIIRLWDMELGQVNDQLLDPFDSGPLNIADIRFSPNGEILAVGGNLWRLEDGSRKIEIEQKTIEGTNCWGSALDFAPDQAATLAGGCFNGHLSVWDLETGAQLDNLEGYLGWVTDLSYSPDGSLLAAIHSEESGTVIQLWQMPGGGPLNKITGENFIQVRFSPDGERLATISSDPAYLDYGSASIWKTVDGERVQDLEIEDASMLAFSPDGSILATGSIDGNLRLWDAGTGELLFNENAHRARVSGLAFTADGTILASASTDGTIHLWGLPALVD